MSKEKARSLVTELIAKEDQEAARLDEAQLVTMGANKTALVFDNLTVYFSYATPVAVYRHREGTIFVTEKKWSGTTSKHINQFIADSEAADTERIPQAKLDKMVDTMSIREAVDTHAATLTEQGGSGAGSYGKGRRITKMSQIKKGDLLVTVSKRFDAVNLVRVADAYDRFDGPYALIVFVDPNNPKKKRRGSDREMSLMGDKRGNIITSDEYYQAVPVRGRRESVQERRNSASVTRGMANKLKSMKPARKCNGCGNTLPAYKGRYPNNCPECGHLLVRAESVSLKMTNPDGTVTEINSDTPADIDWTKKGVKVTPKTEAQDGASFLDKYIAEAKKKDDEKTDDKEEDGEDTEDDDDKKKNGKGKKASPFPPKKKTESVKPLQEGRTEDEDDVVNDLVPYFVKARIADSEEEARGDLDSSIRWENWGRAGFYRVEVAGKEYMIIADEDDAEELAREDIENTLDDMGVTAFTDWFWKGHIDRDAMIRDFRPDESNDMYEVWESYWNEDETADAVIAYYDDRGNDGDFLSAVLSAGADEGELVDWLAEEKGENPDDISDGYGYILANVSGVRAIEDLLAETGEDGSVNWREIVNNDGPDSVFPDWEEKVDRKTENMVDEILDDPKAWGFEDKLEQYVDIEALKDDAIRTDGWAHFISRYDGNYDETGGGLIVVREN